MKVSFIHGLCVKNDAISNAIRDEIHWLSKDNHNDVRLYAYACNSQNLPFSKVTNLMDVVYDPHFQSSDLVIFHFGVYYPLFDLILVAPKRAKRLVVFHNITPKAFVCVEDHSLIDQSFSQMSNIVFAEHVVCDSQTNLDVLRSAGINTPATIMPLAVDSNFQPPPKKPSQFDGVIRIAFIGRFVQSKGPGELVEALDKALQCNQSIHLEVDMVGNLFFSDSALVEDIQKNVDTMQTIYKDRFKVRIHGNASEELKQQILYDADLFVLPTYHEGFCVPILEAFAKGCKVIVYENSNTPAISGGFSKLIPTGDITALSCAISESIKEMLSAAWQGGGTGSYSEYLYKVQKYVQQYSPERSEQHFLKFIKSIVI